MTGTLWFASLEGVAAGGETRTLSLYHIHTKESLTVTYKVNGRYVPSALNDINHLLRDWRRNETTRIDPKMVDLMWELHADLGSKQPVYIVCGYRSPKTNAFLKRIGRNVARQSQHMKGKAIDFFFPDVPLERVRNSAMVRQAGGVGYYPRSVGPNGFVHLDSGRVRYWPRPSPTQLARILRDYRGSIGRRLNHQDEVMVAAAEKSAKTAAEKSAKAKAPALDSNAGAYEEVDEEAAAQAADVKAPRPRAKPAAPATLELAEVAGVPVPLPRPKPIELLFAQAANMARIEPANAAPERPTSARRASPVAASLGGLRADSLTAEPQPEPEQVTNRAAKGSFAAAIRNGTATGTPIIKTLQAAAAGEDVAWGAKTIVFSPDQAVRRDGAPQPFSLQAEASSLVATANAAEAPEPAGRPVAIVTAAMAAPVVATATKADMLIVNRAAKGSLLSLEPVPYKRRQRLGKLDTEG